MYLIRLDDAAEWMNKKNWVRIEFLLDKYNIKPIVGVIPDIKDKEIINKVDRIANFWDLVHEWENKNWAIAMHGNNHTFETMDGGINPVNNYSEFAGLDYNSQSKKIKNALNVFSENNIKPDIFFAPAHTFDENTLLALYKNTDIRIISDTVASNIYFSKHFYFFPQQTGKLRKIPCKIVTACYHPNNMVNADFIELEKFIKNNQNKITNIKDCSLIKRKKKLYDRFLNFLYFYKRGLK